MKVVLTKDVEGWGTIGDVIEVKKGFARNYLIPRGLALELTEENKRFIDNILAQKARKLQREKEKAFELAKKLNGVEIEIERPIGVTGKMYGSVTTSDITEKLKEKELEVDKKKIMLRSPIRNLGSYNIQVKLHPEVSATIKVHVVPESK
ncbi:MAG TPA: 50S ribosomal protein L9 [Sulfurihydrogenibium sp.]|uniref:Large ribosomal subunit protein bL9 n=1 Tax=Sulfurihydrogenibium sp. (strain YO3AOP1) TaxID=436114 RepID=RL9_SULSY|nr:50S ribosomal protein L9 [Sulfurihydrogenibium sp. YO3AOP1]B2V6V8.1 RecName: Full=Large ribosomal subunit protein bL9; AltName: Full=50S ribosomal protein L9 [Sulfurihydrogenibium sp. YO3AOP1]ACD67290.1 ribosomal protein L9 [Sulfurihydrogenibium sp. YO3AOP1]HBT98504.1 50S ribosomal protein L9 [Sulfurihydrogenibium sp.]